MKKYFLGIAAILLAVSFTAFTGKDSRFVDRYWFASNPAGTSITQPARSDTPSATDPSGCPKQSDVFCSLAYDENQTMVDSTGHRVLKAGVDVNAYKDFSQKEE